ncbi:MAG: hypothetical protein ACK4R6_08915 [Spirosomataceae bacterium]
MIRLFRKNLHLFFLFLSFEILALVIHYALGDSSYLIINLVLKFTPFLLYLIATKISFSPTNRNGKPWTIFAYSSFVVFCVFICLFFFKLFLFDTVDPAYKEAQIDALYQKEIENMKELEQRKNVEMDYSKEEIRDRYEARFSAQGLIKQTVWTIIGYSFLSILIVFVILEKHNLPQREK